MKGIARSIERWLVELELRAEGRTDQIPCREKPQPIRSPDCRLKYKECYHEKWPSKNNFWSCIVYARNRNVGGDPYLRRRFIWLLRNSRKRLAWNWLRHGYC